MPESLTHSLFTVIASVLPGRHDALRSELEALDYVGRVPTNDVFGFEDMDMLHYASMFLYDDPEDGWLFVFESNIDGKIGAYLDRLFAVAGQEPLAEALLLKLYGDCADFGGGNLKSLRRYMADRINLPAAGFVSGVGLTRNRIRTDAAIQRVVDGALGSGAPAMSVEQAQEAVFTALADNPATKNFTDAAGDSGPRPGVSDYIASGFAGLLSVFGFGALGIINLLKERAAKEDDFRPHLPMVRAQKIYEDHTPTNHMASIVHLHTDWSRQTAKRMAYKVLTAVVKWTSREGELGGIETIHFAHWAFANNGRRLIFVSNYDGSWDSYLDDFTLKANNGLTLAWAHGLGFPRSIFMLGGGAANGPQFIDWARQSMVPCPVWYNAYPGVSAKNVTRNRKLRTALADAKAGKGGAEWLKYV